MHATPPIQNTKTKTTPPQCIKPAHGFIFCRDRFFVFMSSEFKECKTAIGNWCYMHPFVCCYWLTELNSGDSCTQNIIGFSLLLFFPQCKHHHKGPSLPCPRFTAHMKISPGTHESTYMLGTAFQDLPVKEINQNREIISTQRCPWKNSGKNICAFSIL